MSDSGGRENLGPGAKVKVRSDCESSELRGLAGTVAEKFGRAEHAAFDVRLEDGRSELFWRYEIERESRRILSDGRGTGS